MTTPLSAHDIARLGTITSVAGTDTIPVLKSGVLSQVTLANALAGESGVVGPASATNSNLAAFDGTTGKLIKDSGKAYPSGTIVGTSDSQSLTGKTYNGLTVTTSTGTLTVPNGVTVTGPATSGIAAIINPPPQAGGSTLPVTAAMSGKPILLDTAGGTTATLPAATGSGNKYKFVVSISTTSAAHKILAASSSDFIIGNAYGYTGSTAKVFGSPAATNHSIQMPNSGSQPSGGIIGDVFDFVDIGTNLWHCIGFYQAGTTPTTPFSSATS